jgi:hypothetical protein
MTLFFQKLFPLIRPSLVGIATSAPIRFAMQPGIEDASTRTKIQHLQISEWELRRAQENIDALQQRFNAIGPRWDDAERQHLLESFSNVRTNVESMDQFIGTLRNQAAQLTPERWKYLNEAVSQNIETITQSIDSLEQCVGSAELVIREELSRMTTKSILSRLDDVDWTKVGLWALGIAAVVGGTAAAIHWYDPTIIPGAYHRCLRAIGWEKPVDVGSPKRLHSPLEGGDVLDDGWLTDTALERACNDGNFCAHFSSKALCYMPLILVREKSLWWPWVQMKWDVGKATFRSFSRLAPKYTHYCWSTRLKHLEWSAVIFYVLFIIFTLQLRSKAKKRNFFGFFFFYQIQKKSAKKNSQKGW